MNWDAIGGIADSVGALGVIVSLIYLAIQIRQSGSNVRQNTTALRSSTYQATVDAMAHYNGIILQNEKIAEMTWKGRTEYEALSEPERRHFDTHLASLMQGYSAAA